MKKLLIILALVLFGVSFANNSNIKKLENETCVSNCWVNVTNTETGAVYHFTATATASDCNTATGICLGIVYNKAKKALGIE